MANKNKRNLITSEYIEDVTQYGEFIASFHQWTTYDDQIRISHHLENCTEPWYRSKFPKSYRD